VILPKKDITEHEGQSTTRDSEKIERRIHWDSGREQQVVLLLHWLAL